LISTFNILTNVTNTAECSLFIGISNQGISYWALTQDNSCFALSMYHFNAGTSNDKAADYLKDIVNEQHLLRQPFKKIYIIYTFSEALLVPTKFNYNTNDKADPQTVVNVTGKSKFGLAYRYNLAYYLTNVENSESKLKPFVTTCNWCNNKDCK